MALNFAIDSNVMAEQPTDIEHVAAEAALDQAINGGYVAHVRTKGATVRVTWGVDGAPTAVVAELRTARGGTIAHTISWTDPSGTPHSVDVLWRADPAYAIRLFERYERLTVVFEERAG